MFEAMFLKCSYPTIGEFNISDGIATIQFKCNEPVFWRFIFFEAKGSFFIESDRREEKYKQFNASMAPIEAHANSQIAYAGVCLRGLQRGR